MKLDPATIHTPALKLLDANLLDVAEGRCERLIWSMPPQEGKSQRVSRCFALWMLVRNPELRLGIASYELGTARRWGRTIRTDIATYPELGLRVRSDTSAAHEWQLDGSAGGVYSVGIGGPLTGRPLDGLLVDDPVKGREEADSETYREAAWEWWTETARPRLAPHAFVVLIMTRWHENDLAGQLIANDHDQQWRVINIPAQCETPDTDPLGRELDEYLLSARGRTVEQWQQTRRDVGERGWTALYQGRPAPAEGGMLKRHWWCFDDAPVAYVKPDGTMHAHGMDTVIQSWDMAFKDTKDASYVVGQVWAKRGADAHLLDQVRDRMDFPATCRAVEALSKRWPQATLKLVEDKANGPAVIAQLRQKVGGLVPVTPQGSKEARAAGVSPFVESGNVYLPARSREPWVDGFIGECAAFPAGANDDQVDAMSQGLARLLLGGSSTDFLQQLTSQQPA